MKTKKLLLVSAFLFFAIQFGFAQNKVSGTVTNASDGSPIPGVNVVVQGGSATSTGFDGKYTIDASSGTSLTFSYIGYNSKTLKVSGNVLDVKLSENANALDQVVVVGSTVKTSRKELGNAITSVKSKELMRAQPNSLSSALQGKVAGAQISQNNGDPSGGFSIKLRGTTSIVGSSDPLYVIDGVVMNNSSTNVTNLNVSSGNTNIRLGQNRSVDINPNDIESIEILNGGAAAAIYGSRAANGVVLITSKKGKTGTARYSFATTTNINTLRKKLDINLVNEQFLSFVPRPANSNPNSVLVANNALFPINSSEPSATTVNGILGRNFETLKQARQRYDYQDDIFNSSFGTDTYFSVDGGDAKTKYAASLGYLNNEGIVKNTDFKRLGAKIRLQHEFSPKISASFGLNYTNSFSNEKPDGNVFWSPLNSVTITNNVYNLNDRDAAGNLKAVEPGRINPLSIIETFDITQKTDRIISDLQFNFKPLKNLSADFIFGIDNYSQVGKVYIPRYPYAGVNPGFFNDGYTSAANNRVSQYNNDLNIRYLYEATENIKLTTTAGYNIQMYRDEFTSVEGRDLKPLIEGVNAYNTPLAGVPGAGSEKYNIWGFYLQETIGLFDKIFVTGAIRQDASTVFAKENRKQFYPKLSASYVLSQESFMKNTFVNSARLRASWGESGNLTAIRAYERFTNYNALSLGTNTAFTLEAGRRGNLDIKPERSSTLEFGADLGLFDNRFNLSFSYYDADIEDLLLPVQIAPSSGYTNTIDNLGKMNNKGYEATLNLTAIKKENFNLGFNLTYSSNKNVVTELPQKRFQLDNNPAGAPVFAEVGQPIGIYYGTYYATNPDGSLLLDPKGYPQGEKGDAAGNPQRDVNGQPTGTFLNKKIGDPNPDYIISFGSILNYKKFGFSVLFDGVQGVDIFDADYRTRQGVGSGLLVAKELNGELPRGYIWSIYNIQEFRVVDGSYLKLREVAINYSFGKLSSLFDDLTITASGRNLYSWDKFPSYDPETNSGGQSSIAKYNFGTIPVPATYSLALKFQF
jgi:TonB-linked SusC/RagA family outer membrane protein